MPTLNSTLLTYFAYKIGILLSKPFTEWEAYKLGLIDEKGNVIKKPKTPEEKDALNPFYNLVRKIKYVIVKFVGDNPTVNFLIAFLLVKKESYSENEKNLMIALKNIIQESNYFSWADFIQILKKAKTIYGVEENDFIFK